MTREGATSAAAASHLNTCCLMKVSFPSLSKRPACRTGRTGLEGPGRWGGARGKEGAGAELYKQEGDRNMVRWHNGPDTDWEQDPSFNTEPRREDTP